MPWYNLYFRDAFLFTPLAVFSKLSFRLRKVATFGERQTRARNTPPREARRTRHAREAPESRVLYFPALPSRGVCLSRAGSKDYSQFARRCMGTETWNKRVIIYYKGNFYYSFSIKRNYYYSCSIKLSCTNQRNNNYYKLFLRCINYPFKMQNILLNTMFVFSFLKFSLEKFSLCISLYHSLPLWIYLL